MRARLAPKGLDHSIVKLGVIGMSSLRRTLAATALSLATLLPGGYAGAAGSLWPDLNSEIVKKLVPYAHASKWVNE